jgi:hypothetical protein
MLSIVITSIVILSVAEVNATIMIVFGVNDLILSTECFCSECRYAQSHYGKCIFPLYGNVDLLCVNFHYPECCNALRCLRQVPVCQMSLW